jgi:hypothetical protein
MAYDTDEKLKNYLDTNQLHREQLCLAILALDKHFTNVRPRHPRGGPDGGRDIEAQFRGTELAYGAVGFVNQAADVDEKKRTIRSKFVDDLNSAWGTNPRPSVLVFFTNVNFTVGEKSELVDQAHRVGFSVCEILDRERLRIALDSPDGFAARFQFLKIPMSEAEQASFFSKWGDEIQSVIATGFQEVHATLAQLLFLQEASQPIEGIHVQFNLEREYDASEIGHFRAFWSLYLREPKLGIFSILAGKTDKADRFRKDITENRDERLGIVHGIASGQWKVSWSYHSGQQNSSEATTDEEDVQKYEPTGSGSGVGMKTIKQLVSSYTTSSFIRFEPVLSLMDFDECMLMPILNKSLAEKLESIRIFANGYMLLDLGKEAFQIDNNVFELGLGNAFSDTELADSWVRIRPSGIASAFKLSFSDRVPVRMFKSKKATSLEAE